MVPILCNYSLSKRSSMLVAMSKTINSIFSTISPSTTSTLLAPKMPSQIVTRLKIFLYGSKYLYENFNFRKT